MVSKSTDASASVTRSHFMPAEAFNRCMNPKCAVKMPNGEEKRHCHCCGNVYCRPCTTFKLPLNPQSAMIEIGGVPCTACKLCHEGAVEDGFLDLEADSEEAEKQPVLAMALPVDRRNTRVQVLSVDVPATMSPRSLEENIFSARHVSLPQPDLSPDTENRPEEASRRRDEFKSGSYEAREIAGQGYDGEVKAGRVAGKKSDRETIEADPSWASERYGGGSQHSRDVAAGKGNGRAAGVDTDSREEKAEETTESKGGGFALEDLLAAWGRGESFLASKEDDSIDSRIKEGARSAKPADAAATPAAINGDGHDRHGGNDPSPPDSQSDSGSVVGPKSLDSNAPSDEEGEEEEEEEGRGGMRRQGRQNVNQGAYGKGSAMRMAVDGAGGRRSGYLAPAEKGSDRMPPPSDTVHSMRQQQQQRRQQHQHQQRQQQWQQQQHYPQRQDSDRSDCASEMSDLDDRMSVVLVNEGRVISAGGRGSLKAGYRSNSVSRAESLSASDYGRSLTQSVSRRSAGERGTMTQRGSEGRGGRQGRGSQVSARWRSMPVEQWGVEEVMQWLGTDSLMGDKRSQDYIRRFGEASIDGPSLLAMSREHSCLQGMRPSDYIMFEVARRRLLSGLFPGSPSPSPHPHSSSIFSRSATITSSSLSHSPAPLALSSARVSSPVPHPTGRPAVPTAGTVQRSTSRAPRPHSPAHHTPRPPTPPTITRSLLPHPSHVRTLSASYIPPHVALPRPSTAPGRPPPSSSRISSTNATAIAATAAATAAAAGNAVTGSSNRLGGGGVGGRMSDHAAYGQTDSIRASSSLTSDVSVSRSESFGERGSGRLSGSGRERASGSGKERASGSGRERASGSGSGSRRSGPQLALQASTAAIVRACLSAAGEDEEDDEEEEEEGVDASLTPSGRGRGHAGPDTGGAGAASLRGGRRLMRVESADAAELRRGGDAMMGTRARTRFHPRPPLATAAAAASPLGVGPTLHATTSDACTYALTASPAASLREGGWMEAEEDEEEQSGGGRTAHNISGNRVSEPLSSDSNSNGSSSSSNSSRNGSTGSSSNGSSDGSNRSGPATEGAKREGGGGELGLSESSPRQQGGQLFPSLSEQEKESPYPLPSPSSRTAGMPMSIREGMNVNMGMEEQLLRHQMAEAEEMAIAAHSQLSSLESRLETAILSEYLLVDIVPSQDSQAINPLLSHPLWRKRFVVLFPTDIACFAAAADAVPLMELALPSLSAVGTCPSISPSDLNALNASLPAIHPLSPAAGGASGSGGNQHGGANSGWHIVFVKAARGRQLRLATRSKVKVQLWLSSIQEAMMGG